MILAEKKMPRIDGGNVVMQLERVNRSYVLLIKHDDALACPPVRLEGYQKHPREYAAELLRELRS